MIVRYLRDGDAVDHTPGSDLDAGSVVVLGGLVGVTKRPLKAGERGSLHVTGVFDFPKATGADTAIDAGVNVYWDEGEQQATTESSGNTALGKTTAAAGDDEATVPVRLSP